MTWHVIMKSVDSLTRGTKSTAAIYATTLAVAYVRGRNMANKSIKHKCCITKFSGSTLGEPHKSIAEIF